MSTQDPDAGVPVSILPENELDHCRLLELPAELLSIVTSSDPPVLYIKSRENIDGNVKDANAVLCTADKTFNIRQVSTSNTVFLTKSVERSDEGGGIPRAGIDAVAKCDSTLELISAPKASAASYLKSALPVFTSTGARNFQKVTSKEELFSHIPLSQAECEESWKDLACCESVIPPACYIPSATVKVEVWRKLLTAILAEGAVITDPFIANDLPAFALDLTEEWPEELIMAVLAAMSGSSPGGNLAINEDKCVRFVGLSQLEAQSAGRATETTEFMAAWKDSVPEVWRSKCELSVLQGSYALQDGNNLITFVDVGISGPLNSSISTPAAQAGPGAKRKWHEKFRPIKKT